MELNLSNKEIAEKIMDNCDISYGMIDSPNIIITNGTINFDSGSVNDFNPNAICIYAKDINKKFKTGFIMNHKSDFIQYMDFDYLYFLLENNCLDRNDAIKLLNSFEQED